LPLQGKHVAWSSIYRQLPVLASAWANLHSDVEIFKGHTATMNVKSFSEFFVLHGGAFQNASREKPSPQGEGPSS